MTNNSTNLSRPTEHDLELAAFRDAAERYFTYLDGCNLTGRNEYAIDGWSIAVQGPATEAARVADARDKAGLPFERVPPRWEVKVAVEGEPDRGVCDTPGWEAARLAYDCRNILDDLIRQCDLEKLKCLARWLDEKTLLVASLCEQPGMEESEWLSEEEWLAELANMEANTGLEDAEAGATMLDRADTADDGSLVREAPNSRPVDEAAFVQAAEMIGTRWSNRGGSFDLLGGEDNLSLGTVRAVTDLDWGAFTCDGRAMFFDDLTAARCALLEMVALRREAEPMSWEEEADFWRALAEIDRSAGEARLSGYNDTQIAHNHRTDSAMTEQDDFLFLCSAFERGVLPEDDGMWDTFGPPDSALTIDEILDHFTDCNEPLPAVAAVQLGLPPGTSYGDAVRTISTDPRGRRNYRPVRRKVGLTSTEVAFPWQKVGF